MLEGPAGRVSLFSRPECGYPPRVRKLRLSIAFGLVLAVASPAWAGGARATDQPLVILTEAGRQDVEDAAFFSSVRALAAEIGIGVTAEEVPSLGAVRDALLARARQQSKPFLVAWIMRGETNREVYLFDPWKNRLRTRTIEAGASATANAETLALILRAELLAYLNEPPPPPPPPLPPAPAPLPPRPAPGWGLAASWMAGTFLRGQDPQQGIRLGLARRWPSLRISAHYAFLPGQDVQAQDVTLTVRRHPFDLDLGYASREHHRMRLVAEAFLSGDRVARRTSFAAPPLAAQPDESRFVFAVGLRGQVEVSILRNLTLHLALAPEAVLNPHDLTVVRGTTSTTVARLSPVRVTAEVGLDLLGF